MHHNNCRSHRIGGNALTLLLIIVLLWTVFLATGIFSIPLMPPDEPKYAYAAERMLDSGDFITPYFNCEPRFDKPPLVYWLVALSFKIFGVTPWAARIPSLLAALGIMIAIFMFGRKEFDKSTALISAAVFACFLHVWIMSRAVAPEMLLVFFETAALFSFYYGFEEDKDRHVCLGYLFAALAFLTKGPVGVIIPGAVVFSYFVCRKGFRYTVRKSLNPLGLFIFVLVGFPWYIMMLEIHGYRYFQEFFLMHNVYRFTGKARQHPFNSLYYLPVLLGSLYLWLPFIPAVVSGAGVAIREKRKEIFLIVWLVSVLLFFSVSINKLHNYILIAYPPSAILLGRTLRNLTFIRKSTGKIFIAIAAGEFLGSVGLFVYMRNISPALLAGCAVIVFISLVIALKGVSLNRVLTLVMAKGLVLLVIANLYIASYARQVQPSYSFLQAESLIEKDPIYFYRKDSEDIVFYAKQCVAGVKGREALEELSKRHPEFILLIREKDLWEIKGLNTEDIVPFDDIAGRKRYLIEVVGSRLPG
jgi:4-amino-4-deoxy-L-arabinose transferase-like glycosyltransferase